MDEMKFVEGTDGEIAQRMLDGKIVGPVVTNNCFLINIRITGTGETPRTYRGAERIFIRPPGVFLSDKFLAMCNGLPCVYPYSKGNKDAKDFHPADGELDYENWKEYVVGTVMLPYIHGKEVWGIAKVFDLSLLKDIVDGNIQSTSPFVLSPNKELPDGKYEEKLEDLNHVAFCEAGHWDQNATEPAIKVGDVLFKKEPGGDELMKKDPSENKVDFLGDPFQDKELPNLYQELSESEKTGLKFGMLPGRLQKFNLTKEQVVQLVRMAEKGKADAHTVQESIIKWEAGDKRGAYEAFLRDEGHNDLSYEQFIQSFPSTIKIHNENEAATKAHGESMRAHADAGNKLPDDAEFVQRNGSWWVRTPKTGSQFIGHGATRQEAAADAIDSLKNIPEENGGFKKADSAVDDKIAQMVEAGKGTSEIMRALGKDPYDAESEEFKIIQAKISEWYKNHKGDVREVPLSELKMGDGGEDKEKVGRFVEAIKDGKELPAIVVDDDGIIMDGNHRYQAYKLAGKNTIPTVIGKKDTSEAQRIVDLGREQQQLEEKVAAAKLKGGDSAAEKRLAEIKAELEKGDASGDDAQLGAIKAAVDAGKDLNEIDSMIEKISDGKKKEEALDYIMNHYHTGWKKDAISVHVNKHYGKKDSAGEKGKGFYYVPTGKADAAFDEEKEFATEKEANDEMVRCGGTQAGWFVTVNEGGGKILLRHLVGKKDDAKQLSINFINGKYKLIGPIKEQELHEEGSVKGFDSYQQAVDALKKYGYEDFKADAEGEYGPALKAMERELASGKTLDDLRIMFMMNLPGVKKAFDEVSRKGLDKKPDAVIQSHRDSKTGGEANMVMTPEEQEIMKADSLKKDDTIKSLQDEITKKADDDKKKKDEDEKRVAADKAKDEEISKLKDACTKKDAEIEGFKKGAGNPLAPIKDKIDSMVTRLGDAADPELKELQNTVSMLVQHEAAEGEELIGADEDGKEEMVNAVSELADSAHADITINRPVIKKESKFDYIRRVLSANKALVDAKYHFLLGKVDASNFKVAQEAFASLKADVAKQSLALQGKAGKGAKVVVRTDDGANTDVNYGRA